MTPLILFHTALSLFAIGAGVVFTYRLLNGKLHGAWTHLYLATTIGTSLSGFIIPADRFLPSHAFGILSIGLLAASVRAYYTKHLSGRWMKTYLVTALFAFYLNVFVLVVQSFLKFPALKALAPTQTEAPFAAVQTLVFFAFIGIGYRALQVAKSHPVAAK
jgi:hypothetical protein